MKIKPKLSELAGDAIQTDQKLADKIASKLTEKQAALLGAQREKDSVALSTLASALNNQLNPAQLHSERRAKVEDLKTQIANGTYKPSSIDVAKSIADEISLEILSQGGLIQQDEN